MLKQRIITAVILIPITILILYYLSLPSFCFLTAFIALGAAWEWTNLMEMKKTSWRLYYLLLLCFMFFGALFISPPLIFLCAFVWWLFAALLVVFYPRGSFWWGKSVFWRGLMGFFVFIPCWAALNDIRRQNDGFYALLFLFVLIWGADSAAYFAGRKWGKHKLAPRVSPGKSLEGLIGAIIFSVVITLTAAWVCHIPVQVWQWGIVLALTTVLFSIVGDLFESMLKRQAGLKDSGHILPGHGGLLDRIDSLTAAAPVFAFLSWSLGQYLG